MYIHAVSHYLPTQVVGNEHFTKLNGLSSDWIIERTGIEERRKAAADENTNTMAVEVVRLLQDKTDLSSIDLIVGGHVYAPRHNCHAGTRCSASSGNSGDSGCIHFVGMLIAFKCD